MNPAAPFRPHPNSAMVLIIPRCVDISPDSRLGQDTLNDGYGYSDGNQMYQSFSRLPTSYPGLTQGVNPIRLGHRR